MIKFKKIYYILKIQIIISPWRITNVKSLKCNKYKATSHYILIPHPKQENVTIALPIDFTNKYFSKQEKFAKYTLNVYIID